MNCGAWLGWQIDYLLWFQWFRDASHHIFDNFFIYITLFGEITIPIIVISIFYWSVNKKIGQYLLFSHVIGYLVNVFAKVTACIYRPWVLDARVKPLAQAIPAATGYSFPSGHTAGAMSVWGGLAVWFWKNKIVRYSCIAIVLCVMLSRNYLGVHTPQDVVVSFILSCFVLMGTYKLVNYLESDENKNKDVLIAGVLFGLTVLLTLYVFFKHYPIHYLFGKILYDPTPIKYETLNKSGVLFGVLAGWLLERRFINFEADSGTLIKKILRTVLGIGLLLGMYSITKTMDLSVWVMFAQFFMIGLFITFIHPLIIKKWFS